MYVLIIKRFVFRKKGSKLSKTWTYILVLFVMILWGLNVVAVKFLVESLPPVAMQGLRIFIGGIIAIIVLFFLKDLRKLTKKEWGYTIVAAVFGQMLHHSLLALGLVQTTAGNASLILGLIPLATAIFAMLFLKDSITLLRTIGIALGFGGVCLVVLQNAEIGVISPGDILVFIAMLSQAFSFVIIKKVTATLSSRQLTAVMLLVGAVMLLILSFIFEPQGVGNLVHGNTIVWTVLVLSAVFATGLGHILYNAAIQEIGAGQTAIFNNLVPFISLIGAFFLLGEAIYTSQIIGFVLIVLGVLFGTGYIETRVLKKRMNSIGKKQKKQTA
ncbi:DMT family transporter [Evansella cellulosilytica]|uniref:EamA domain-containing protein n=1 Tax=Evansella cellulosilytica (strain ATCC 21833 / DSM 2522 / FERM P-1141 / JCM 9156 / N-4) TaxID=649639 RepID=E6U0W6_EVAC2|nr:DMT family transporter [Evansella cellulosilytica]ADU30278.1 protein of unknown function DUF6 transmembrane [Evansella cellulosilytica DSM 2522]